MPKAFLERLRAGELMVSDGATGTNHQQNGLPPGTPPDEWVFDQPEKVMALHRAFVDAGSDIILTCTFNGTRARLRESQYADKVAELNQRAAELARNAAKGHASVFVAGSMGPTGMLMEPLGELTHEQCAEFYAEQARALTQGGVDLLLLETFFALDEINAAIDGVQSVSQLPLIASFSYDQGTRTMMGTRPSQFVQAIAPRGVAALGANCGKAPEAMLEIVKEMKAEMLRGWIRGAHHMVYTERSECAQHDIPIWCKPNAGLPRMVGDREVYDATPEVMGEFAKKYVETGAQVVGGCCGNTPAHVAAIARAVKNK